MSIFETLGELIGKALRSLFDSVSGLLRFKVEQLSDIDTELASASLDPDKFRTAEVKDLVKDIKEQLKTSPAGLSDWIQTIMGGFMTKIWDVAMGILLPSKMDTFEDAKASATWISNLFADFILLSAVLDMVGTALSATLVRNLIHIFRLFAATFGMDRYLDAVIAPALSTSIVPMLTRGYNKQYRTFIPPATDLVRWQAREVFEPTMRAKYGLDSEKEELERELFYEQGLDDTQIDNYWAAHWEHASWMQIVEMLHRGLITEEEVYMWFRTVEIVPYWRDLLIKTAYTWPTRVDVRRWWDMRTIDETELRRLYSGMGYRGVNLDNYVLWTKVYVAFPDLMARWTKGWITEDDVRAELTGLGMPAERVEEMIQTRKSAVEAGQVEEGKALTKTEIYKGVKEGRITRDQGIDLLMDMNYNLSQAEYLLDINVGALAGSPETYEEFKKLTTEYRIAVGKEAKPMPEELKQAAVELARVTLEVEALERSIVEEEKTLVPEEVLPEAATARLDELRIILHRAESELARVKSDYLGKLAQWRHGE